MAKKTIAGTEADTLLGYSFFSRIKQLEYRSSLNVPNVPSRVLDLFIKEGFEIIDSQWPVRGS